MVKLFYGKKVKEILEIILEEKDTKNSYKFFAPEIAESFKEQFIDFKNKLKIKKETLIYILQLKKNNC